MQCKFTNKNDANNGSEKNSGTLSGFPCVDKCLYALRTTYESEPFNKAPVQGKNAENYFALISSL